MLKLEGKGTLKIIEEERDIMVQKGLKYGFCDLRTVAASKKLDQLLNRVQKSKVNI